MEIGATVLFERARPHMNRRLRDLVGETGVITLKGEGANQKVLVKFSSWDVWWISPDLLKVTATANEDIRKM